MASFYTPGTAEESTQQAMDMDEGSFGFSDRTAAAGWLPEGDAASAGSPPEGPAADIAKSQQILLCEECGNDSFTKCWHQMTYEEWLEDVSRQEALRRESAAAAAAAAAAQLPPPPPPATLELFLRPRSRRQHQQWPRPSAQGLMKKPLRVQMLRVHHKQKVMPALLEVPRPRQSTWSDDEDDVNVIF